MSSTEDSTGTKVIIIGAGTAGLTLAIFLKVKGYQPVVFEQTSSPSQDGIGHGYGLHVNRSTYWRIDKWFVAQVGT